MIADHPRTRFICAHVANSPEDLAYVASFLDSHANAAVDLFGVDMPVRTDVYRAHFRFLESRDQYFEYPDYAGRWGHCRWRIYGLGLPAEALRKIYSENALRIIPGLKL